MIDRSTAWKIYSQRPGPTHVLAKMYYGDESEYLPVGSGLVNLEDEDFLPLITTIPHRLQDVDFWTREFSIADLTLEILNLPFHGSIRFSDLLDERGSGNDIGFENRPADVRLWRPGITTWDDCFKLFPVGLMRKPYVQEGMVYVEVQDHTLLTLQNVQLDRMQAADAADTDQGLPAESQGLIKPSVYGDRTYLQGDDAKSKDTVQTLDNMTPCRYRGMDNTGRHQWLVMKRTVNEILNTTGQGQIWGEDDQLNRRVRLNTFTVEQNTDDGCIISTDADPLFLDYWYAKGTVGSDVTANAALQNEERLGDKAFDIFALFQIADAGDATDYATATIPFADYDNQSLLDADISAVKMYTYGLLVYSGAAGDGDYEVTLDGSVLNPDQYPTAGGTYPEARSNVTGGDSTKAEITAAVDLKFEKKVASGGGGASYSAYEVYKEIQYYPRRVIPLLFAGKAAEIPAVISDRGSHADNGAAGDLAENLATLIELTLRNEAGLGSSRLDLDSLDSASNDVPSLKGTPIFLEQPDSYLQALFSLVQQFRGFIWWTPIGELFLKILKDDYTTPDKTIDGNLITSLNFGRTDIKRLYTAVQLLYYEVEGKGIIETTLAEDTTAQTWYNITQVESLLKFDAPAFKEQASANSQRDYFLANHLNIHSTAGCELPIMYNHLDIGDLVGFENLPEDMRGHDLSASYTIAGQTIRPYFLIHSVDRSDGIKFKAFQIHKLD